MELTKYQKNYYQIKNKKDKRGNNVISENLNK